jgi:hypothetical protein
LQRRAIRIEIQFGTWVGKWGISTAALARKLGVPRWRVDFWRNQSPAYRAALLKRLAAPLSKRLARHDREERSQRGRLPLGSTPEGSAKQLRETVRENWDWNRLWVDSPLTGEPFFTPEDYATHVAQHGVLLDCQLWPWKPPERVKPLPEVEYLRSDYSTSGAPIIQLRFGNRRPRRGRIKTK